MSEEWRTRLQASALAFVGTVLFPRLAYRLRSPTRLGLRGVIAFVAFELLHVLLGFAIRAWVMPWAERNAKERELVVPELRGRLGREPTNDAILAELMERSGRTRGDAG